MTITGISHGRHRGFFRISGKILLSLLITSLFLTAPAEAAKHRKKAVTSYSYSCTIIRVSDGDTVKCLGSDRKAHKIRLKNIDAPEKSQQYGQQSGGYLRGLVLRKKVSVTTFGTDRYGRELSVIHVNGINVNQKLVESGNAWAFRRYLSGNDARIYTGLEASARKNRRGLWKYPNPMEPSVYRHSKKAKRGK